MMADEKLERLKQEVKAHTGHLNSLLKGLDSYKIISYGPQYFSEKVENLFRAIRNLRSFGDESEDNEVDRDILSLILFFINEYQYEKETDPQKKLESIHLVLQSAGYLSKRFKGYGKNTDREFFWRNIQYLEKMVTPWITTERSQEEHQAVLEFIEDIRTNDFLRLRVLIEVELEGLLEAPECSLKKASDGVQDKERELYDCNVALGKAEAGRASKDKLDSLRAKHEKLMKEKNLAKYREDRIKQFYDPRSTPTIYFLTTFFRDVDSIEKMIQACDCAERVLLDSQERVLTLFEKYAILRVFEVLGEYGHDKNLSPRVKALDTERTINWITLTTLRNKLQHLEFKIKENKEILSEQFARIDFKEIIYPDIKEIKKMLCLFQKKLLQFKGNLIQLRQFYLYSDPVADQNSTALLRLASKDIASVILRNCHANPSAKKDLHDFLEHGDASKLGQLKRRYPSGLDDLSWDFFEQNLYGKAGVRIAAFSEPLLLAKNREAEIDNIKLISSDPCLLISRILEIIQEMAFCCDAAMPGLLQLFSKAPVFMESVLLRLPYGRSRNNVSGYREAVDYLESNQSCFFIPPPDGEEASFFTKFRYRLHRALHPHVDLLVLPVDDFYNNRNDNAREVAEECVNKKSPIDVASEVIHYAKFIQQELKFRELPVLIAALEYLVAKIHSLLRLLKGVGLDQDVVANLHAQRNYMAHGDVFLRLGSSLPVSDLTFRYAQFYFSTIRSILHAEMERFDNFASVLQAEGIVGALSAPNGSLRCP